MARLRLFLPVFASGATLYDHELRVEVDVMGRVQKELNHLLSASFAELSSGYLPQYPTGPATCDGSQLACPGDGSDPCAALQNCSAGGYNDCFGKFKICLPNKNDPKKCESGDDCLLRCTGTFAEASDGSPLKCKDLAEDKCNGRYAADPGYLENGRGYACGLKEDRSCGEQEACGVQNPPESLGEKQCIAPEVFKGAATTCQTKRIRPNQECKTKCLAGYSPSVAALKCEEGGTLEPKSFTCIAKPCRVKVIENALKSGCKEGPETGEAVIESGLVCTLQCQEGFYRSDDVLRCHAEQLSPASFSCEAPCRVPTVSNAAEGGLCKEGKSQILPFTSCTPQCAAGYSPSVASLSCRNARFSPASVTCNPDPCGAPAGVEFMDRKGSCQEGSLVASGSSCTTQCSAGYTPSVASLACNAKTLTPATFQCVPNACRIPSIKNSAGNGCQGLDGELVDSGKECQAVCKSGYSPTEKSMKCYAQTLTPKTFECLPDACDVPFAKNQEGSGCLGVAGQVKGTVIEHGETCRAECKEGYHSSTESLTCTTGKLAPSSFRCLEDACPAVQGVANAPKLGCKEGKSIDSQKSCTTLCKRGYKPNFASLTCKLGKFFPSSYMCEPEGCPVPSVANRLDSGCSGLRAPAVVDSGKTCATQCAAGYTPTVDALKCFAGTLNPATFSCSEDACDAPSGIQNGAPNSCKEGKVISSGATCTTQCGAGFVPSSGSLTCSLGSLSPSSFSCQAQPCRLPRVQKKKGNGCAGRRGGYLASGSSCIPQCQPGYTPSETSLTCSATKLTPKRFACNPDPCPLPSISKAQGNGCRGFSGSMMDSGSKCKAECQSGYTPSLAELTCTAGVLSPETFTCNAQPCKLPRVPNQAGNGCQGSKGDSIASGAECQTSCVGGFTPDVEKLSCFASQLTPSSFTCNPTPCQLPRVGNALGNGCKGKVGTVMASGASCSTSCLPGFEATVAKLDCAAGTLSPASFRCEEVKCRAPIGLAHAPRVGCAEGHLIAGGRSCTPRCNSGYTPSAATLACRRGVLEPSSYACQPNPCTIPAISNAASPKCEEGDTLQHGQKCTPQCKPNYIPSKSSLTCMAGALSPATFGCQAPCAAPTVMDAKQPCKEGNLIQHGGSCTSQCNAGFSATSGSLECNNGRLGGQVVCQIEMPRQWHGEFYQCWTGDPHYTCRGGRRSDPLVPGTHWVLKQSCPNSPNFMWVQGIFGPVRPAATMATAFGGMFLSRNVLTIRTARNPPWIVKWNDQDIRRVWKAYRKGRWRRKRRNQGKYYVKIGGSLQIVTMVGNRIEVSLSYGLTYRASRHYWNRQDWKVSGIYYQDFYSNNQLWTKLCWGGRFGGESVELPNWAHHWRPRGNDRMVSGPYDLFQQSRAAIETKLNSLTSMASLFAEEELARPNMSEVATEAPPCTGKKLEEAQKQCAVLKKEKSEEEAEEIAEDKEARDNQENAYESCIADACGTDNKEFGEAGKEAEEESEMQTALKHKKEFKIVAAGAHCKEGWMSTDPNEEILMDEEKERAQKKKNSCKTACTLCRPKHRRYLVGPTVLHNETREACVAQRLAMPKNTEDAKRLWELQKEHCTSDKGWLGAKYKEGVWKWDDDTTVGLQIGGHEGDYLCIDKDEGTFINCEHSADEKNDALCEGVWY